jgi:hypothetical protein
LRKNCLGKLILTLHQAETISFWDTLTHRDWALGPLTACQSFQLRLQGHQAILTGIEDGLQAFQGAASWD